MPWLSGVGVTAATDEQQQGYAEPFIRCTLQRMGSIVPPFWPLLCALTVAD